MTEGMTRQRARRDGRRAGHHARAALRAEQPRADQEDCAQGRARAPAADQAVHRLRGTAGQGAQAPHASTGKVISAKRAAGALHAQRVGPAGPRHRRGLPEEHRLRNGEPRSFDDDEAKIGIKSKRWEYETLPCEVTLKGPADFDFNWARLIGFSQEQRRGAGPAGGGQAEVACGRNSARMIKQAANLRHGFSLMACTRCRWRACATCSS